MYILNLQMNTTQQCSVCTEVLQTSNLWLPLNMCMSETEGQVSTRELSLVFILNNLVGAYQCCGETQGFTSTLHCVIIHETTV